MAKYLVYFSMGYAGTTSNFETVEIPDNEDAHESEKLKESLDAAWEHAKEKISLGFKRID